MSDTYSYLLSELLKRNTQLHGDALKHRGYKENWTDKAIKVMHCEIRANPLKSNTKIKSMSGHVWGWLRTQDITTRHIYQLLLQWALYLTQEKLLYTYTADYAALLEELRISIESGAGGEVEDIKPEDIIAEWEFVQENYYSPLHNLCHSLIGTL